MRYQDFSPDLFVNWVLTSLSTTFLLYPDGQLSYQGMYGQKFRKPDFLRYIQR